jgi:hypothetical protein
LERGGQDIARLMFVFLFAFIDRINVGFSKLQMVNQLGFSSLRIGYGDRPRPRTR